MKKRALPQEPNMCIDRAHYTSALLKCNPGGCGLVSGDHTTFLKCKQHICMKMHPHTAYAIWCLTCPSRPLFMTLHYITETTLTHVLKFKQSINKRSNIWSFNFDFAPEKYSYCNLFKAHFICECHENKHK